jgi:hypothetical protein
VHARHHHGLRRERTQAGERAARVQGAARTTHDLGKGQPIDGPTRPGVNREPSGRSRRRVSQANALTTASELLTQVLLHHVLGCAAAVGASGKSAMSCPDGRRRPRSVLSNLRRPNRVAPRRRSLGSRRWSGRSRRARNRKSGSTARFVCYPQSPLPPPMLATATHSPDREVPSRT